MKTTSTRFAVMQFGNGYRAVCHHGYGRDRYYTVHSRAMSQDDAIQAARELSSLSESAQTQLWRNYQGSRTPEPVA